jgi:hypothetical protein
MKCAGRALRIDEKTINCYRVKPKPKYETKFYTRNAGKHVKPEVHGRKRNFNIRLLCVKKAVFPTWALRLDSNQRPY